MCYAHVVLTCFASLGTVYMYIFENFTAKYNLVQCVLRGQAFCRHLFEIPWLKYIGQHKFMVECIKGHCLGLRVLECTISVDIGSRICIFRNKLLGLRVVCNSLLRQAFGTWTCFVELDFESLHSSKHFTQ
jgi:hypothetical protein